MNSLRRYFSAWDTSLGQRGNLEFGDIGNDVQSFAAFIIRTRVIKMYRLYCATKELHSSLIHLRPTGTHNSHRLVGWPTTRTRIAQYPTPLPTYHDGHYGR